MERSSEAYKAALASFDWHYQFSDSHQTWKRGQEKLQQLNAMQSEFDRDGKIWMSVRPNLFGCPLPEVKAIIGSEPVHGQG